MGRPDLRAAVTAAMAESARWLLAAIGTAMGAPAPACTSRGDALERAAAAAATRGGGRHGWTYSDAVRIGNRWICVIEDRDSVYLIEIAVHSGVAQALTQVCKPADGDDRIVVPDAAGGKEMGRRATGFWWGGQARPPRPRTARRRPGVRRPQPAPTPPRRPQTPR